MRHYVFTDVLIVTDVNVRAYILMTNSWIFKLLSVNHRLLVV